MLLYYILCMRLKAGQTTIFQPLDNRAFLFTQGCKVVRSYGLPRCCPQRDLVPLRCDRGLSQSTCHVLSRDSPWIRVFYDCCWHFRGWTHCRLDKKSGPHHRYCMRPFDLAELIQAWVKTSITIQQELTPPTCSRDIQEYATFTTFMSATAHQLSCAITTHPIRL